VATSASVLIEVPSLDDLLRVNDHELIAKMGRWAEARRMIDAGLATLAGAVAARSSIELGLRRSRTAGGGSHC